MDGYSREAKSPSWTKHLKVGPLVGIHSPVAFLKKDELLMDTDDGLLPRRSLGIFPFMGLNQEHMAQISETSDWKQRKSYNQAADNKTEIAPRNKPLKENHSSVSINTSFRMFYRGIIPNTRPHLDHLAGL
ncbi:hypothetical protein TIFTF001_013149 [Ficus carica]|uniref:Uncharacterized protein n=1 Tax=Ficus carica TaxID=3494 RepID=A0AA88AHA5_FICCA|nr:hypothetical protein TIFTF001_013149 [Ficus carica]